MIRPFTCACLLLAAGSGLWLYHVKHKAQVLDRRIERTIRAADVAREHTTMLRADWALLNDPQRLQALAASYLQLQPITPAQFVPLSQLDGRLPPVPPPPVPDTTPAVIDAPGAPEAVVAQATPDAPPDATADAAPHQTAARADGVASVASAPPPAPAEKPVKVAEARPPAPPRPAARPPAPAPVRPRPPLYTAFATQRTARRPTLRRVDALSLAPQQTARAYTGSVLGAAAPMHLPPPVPMAASYAVNQVMAPPGR